MIDEFDVSEAFDGLPLPYNFVRYTISDVAGRDVRTPSAPVSISCYIHPHDMKTIVYDGNEYRDTAFIKIFSQVDADIKADDTVTYQGDEYRVMNTAKRIVGNYQKFIGEML